MRRLLLILLPIVMAVAVLLLNARQPKETGTGMVLAASMSAEPSTSGCEAPPALTYTVPSDIAGHNSQANVNCLAWQDFISLNWQASLTTCMADETIPASRFGEPGNTAPVVWETYKEASEVFLANAEPPSPWCSGRSSMVIGAAKA